MNSYELEYRSWGWAAVWLVLVVAAVILVVASMPSVEFVKDGFELLNKTLGGL